MKFAQSRYQPDILQAIHQWLAQVRPHATAWFLVDGGMLDPMDRKKLTQKAKVATQAFKGSPLDAYGDYGPWLYQPPVSRRTEWTAMLRDATDGKPALSLIETNRTRGQIEDCLVRLATANPAGAEQPLYCRFADTRILPPLISVLSHEQRTTVTHAIYRWTYVNRSGALANAIDTDPSTQENTGNGNVLALDADQFAKLLDASEADTLFQLLHETSPHLLPEDDRGNLHARISSIRASARTLKIEGTSDQLRFTVLALMFGDDYFRNPILTPTWKAIRNGETTLSASISTWSDTFWKALAPERQHHA